MPDESQNETKPETANSTPNSSDKSPWLAPHRFQPGQSGNPSGRPKRKPITEAFQKVFEDDPAAAEAFVRSIMGSRSAMAHVMVLKEAGERLEGKVTQPVEHSLNQDLLDRLDRALKASE